MDSSTTIVQPKPTSFPPEWALVAVTMVWGCTFLVVQAAVTVGGPLAFVGTRFAIAALIGALIYRRQLRAVTRRELAAGGLIGISIFFGYTLQTYGLLDISSSKSAFITAFYVPLVPFFQWIFLKHKPHPVAVTAVLVAFAGLALLAGPDGTAGTLGRGEVLTALGAAAIACEIILISRVARDCSIARVTIVQLAVASALAFAAMPVAGEGLPPLSLAFIGSALALGGASMLIQFVMNWAQKRVSATRATLIYAGEPVWAGLAGALAGERVTLLAVAGAVLIVFASIFSEWRPGSRRAKT
jgi:drug/metabolite transporter (DMT)-like permease